jgi:hypothetical protein
MRGETEKHSKKITHITTYLLSLGGYSPVAGCCVCDSHQKVVMEDKGDNKSRAWSLRSTSIATGRREDGDDTGRWSRTDNRQFSSRYLHIVDTKRPPLSVLWNLLPHSMQIGPPQPVAHPLAIAMSKFYQALLAYRRRGGKPKKNSYSATVIRWEGGQPPLCYR